MLNLPDAPGLTLGALRTAGIPFDICCGCLNPVNGVQVFDGVIGQHGEMICSGDFIKISSSFKEIYYQVF